MRILFTPQGQRIMRVGVKLQGLRILPGEEILVVAGGVSHKHTYAGRTTDLEDPEFTDYYWMDAPLTTAEGMGPGPYRLENLRHPDVLTAFTKAISDGEE